MLWDKNLWGRVDFPLDSAVGGHMGCVSTTKQVLLSIPLSFVISPVPLINGSLHLCLKEHYLSRA